MNDVTWHLYNHISINPMQKPTSWRLKVSHIKKPLEGTESSFLGFPNEKAVLWRDDFLQHNCQRRGRASILGCQELLVSVCCIRVVLISRSHLQLQLQLWLPLSLWLWLLLQPVNSFELPPMPSALWKIRHGPDHVRGASASMWLPSAKRSALKT